MKLFKLVFTSIFVLSVLATVAQDRPQDYDPFYRKGKATIVLNSGETINGNARFYILGSEVEVMKEFADKPQRYSVSQVNHFSINDSVWYSKLTKGAELTFDKTKTFVYLKSAPEGKWKLFERTIYESDMTAAGMLGLDDKLVRDYFIAFPDKENDIYSVTGMKFIPFAKKMSALTSDCPALSQKIAEKAEGYSLSVMPKISTNVKKMVDANVSARPENFWLKIVTEYNECK